ncbi:hypothetical protein GN244_ATG09177 [Phytophthora infestans]|uniref:BZIP domain-containing protein n=1 Tax=Phytophthora infestans TaxID=4787 RepID=A0A833S2C2_PHYIN|nr:hypothetical protein GN244_ATG09177 [Phytophthora infestans]
MPSSVYDDTELLLDEASVLAFLADCDLVNGIEPLPALSKPSSCGSTTILSGSSVDSYCSIGNPGINIKKMSWRQRRKEKISNLRDKVKQLSIT